MTLSFPDPDIAVLTFDDPEKSANILSSRVLDELDEHFTALESRTDLAGLILRSGKPGVFIAGADLREFVAWIDADSTEVNRTCQRGQELFGRLAKFSFVTVAAIDGLCLGGGAEMAVWCDRRIMTTGPKTQYGFPEVKLGLFPGWGGTARAPRIVGLSNAVELIASGDSIDAKAAATMGLANDVVEPDRLDAAAIAMVRHEQETGQYRRDREAWSGPIDINETELAFLGATASAYLQQQTKGHYPAPLAALEVMLGAAGVDLQQACAMEVEGFSQLFGTSVNRSLLNVFFLQDRNKKDAGVDDPALQPRSIGPVGVIGAGIMGQGIAAANVKRKHPVTMTDMSEEALATGVRNILEEVAFNKTTRKADVQRAIEFAPLLNGSHSGVELADSTLVIEAVIEKLDIKKQVFAELEPRVGDEVILASNTSTIPITRIAANLAHPDRFCGIHFFNPVRKMPLVEIIRGEKTSDQTVATAVAYTKSLGKSPIVVADGPGFLVNRLLLPYMNEALELLQSGLSMQKVDRVAKAFGMPMGPIMLFDVVGIDTALHAGRVMYEAFPDRVVASELLTAMFKAGRLGQKSGGGFFAYAKGRARGKPDPEVERMIEERQQTKEDLTDEQITMRLFLPMVIEATRVLEDQLVRDVRDVDLGLIYGIGFPPFRGGLLFWADMLGAAKIIERLKPYESLGKRYHPSDMLLEMAREGRTFYH
ncbi:MAG: 3-hydroxyacyl-CoA dehydrogenase NAD-binding domain-containing protein [Pirellulales bacterium]